MENRQKKRKLDRVSSLLCKEYPSIDQRSISNERSHYPMKSEKQHRSKRSVKNEGEMNIQALEKILSGSVTDAHITPLGCKWNTNERKIMTREQIIYQRRN
jgi:hypothetical protein